MNIAFRVDASLQMGSGHIMRCMTLAKALRSQGASCEFICRDHVGNLADLLRDEGFSTTMLLEDTNQPSTQSAPPE